MTERPSGSRSPQVAWRWPSPRRRTRAVHPLLQVLPLLLPIAPVLAIPLKNRVLAQELMYRPERGDVIVFSDPKGHPVDRVKVIGGAFDVVRPPAGVGWVP